MFWHPNLAIVGKKIVNSVFLPGRSVVLGRIISQMFTGRLNTRLLSRGVNSFTCLAWRTENIQTKCFKINKSKQNKTKHESYLRENYPWSDHNFCRNSTTLGLYRNDLYRNSLYRKVYYRFTGEFNNPCWTLVLFLSIKPIEGWG